MGSPCWPLLATETLVPGARLRVLPHDGHDPPPFSRAADMEGGGRLHGERAGRRERQGGQRTAPNHAPESPQPTGGVRGQRWTANTSPSSATIAPPRGFPPHRLTCNHPADLVVRCPWSPSCKDASTAVSPQRQHGGTSWSGATWASFLIRITAGWYRAEHLLYIPTGLERTIFA